jgi:DNA-binding XRE family transcriptional regulator
MLNTQEIVKKLEMIFDYYQLNASSFADKIGVQRSSLSHLLSGRNKPGLEFVIKIVEYFPEVDLYWFLMDMGTFPKSELSQPKEPIKQETIKFMEPEPTTPSQLQTPIMPEQTQVSKGAVAAKVDKIAVLYTDGSFKSYSPQGE